MGRKGETTSYTQPSFEEIYSKKLDAIKVQLKCILYGDTPFVVGQEYACKCGGRINIHSQEGRWFCLRCALRPGGQAPRWSKTTRARIEEIMANYPDYAACYQEWQARQTQPWTPPPIVPREPKPEPDPERLEFGRRLKEARKAKNMTLEQIAAKITKKNGGKLSPSSIQMYESGSIIPSDYIIVQLVKILDLELEKVKA